MATRANVRKIAARRPSRPTPEIAEKSEFGFVVVLSILLLIGVGMIGAVFYLILYA